MQYEIQQLQDSNADHWEKVNESHEHGSFISTLKWKRKIEQIVKKCRDIAHNRNLSFVRATVREDTKEETNFFRTLHPSYEITFVNMILDLRENSPDTIWKNVLSWNTKRKIRRFETDGFKVSTGNSPDQVKAFCITEKICYMWAAHRFLSRILNK